MRRSRWAARVLGIRTGVVRWKGSKAKVVRRHGCTRICLPEVHCRRRHSPKCLRRARNSILRWHAAPSKLSSRCFCCRKIFLSSVLARRQIFPRKRVDRKPKQSPRASTTSCSRLPPKNCAPISKTDATNSNKQSQKTRPKSSMKISNFFVADRGSMDHVGDLDRLPNRRVLRPR